MLYQRANDRAEWEGEDLTFVHPPQVRFARSRLQQLHTGHHRTAAVLREKVSFHLIAPMIEAWLFADDRALAAAGVPDATTVHLDASTDPEQLVTADPAYLLATEADCPTWAAIPQQRKKKKLRPKWLGAQPRE